MILGLSTGILRESLTIEEILSFYKEIGCEAIELSPDHWQNITKSLLNDFKYISVHAGASFPYADNEETHRELKSLEGKHNEVGFRCVVVHPPDFKDWQVLKRYKLPWAIENMDNLNTLGTTPEEVLAYSKRADCNVALDLNHCFTHDETMKLADQFYEVLGEKIVELHISGYKDRTDEGRHLPLSLTKQLAIIKKAKNIPIIGEADHGTKESAKEEFEYLKEMLKNSFK